MMWILFAAASAVFAGLTSVFAKCGVRRTDSSVATAVRTVVVLIFAWLLVFITGAQNGISNISSKTWLFLTLSGLATGASWLCYFKALQKGDVNKVVPVDKSSVVLTMLLAAICFDEPFSIWTGMSVLGIGIGTLLMIDKKDVSAVKEEGKGWLFYAVLSALFASLTAILGKIGIEGVDSNLGTAIRTIVVLGMAWLMVFVTGKGGEVRKIPLKELCFIFLSGLATGASWLCYYRALQDGLASVVVAVDKLSVVVSVTFAYFVFGERLSLKALLGLFILVDSTLLLVMLTEN